MIARIFSILFKAALAYALIVLVLVTLYAWIPPVSTLMVWRWITFQPVTRVWQPLESISPNLVNAVVVSEDSRLCFHSGIDWRELRDAIREADEPFEARGASTIAMQTARNLFLWTGRQFIRKAIEMPIALYLDLAWPKRRLVEVYLNIAEWGPGGEFGAEAAAQRAFRKSAVRLGAQEASLLAGTLPNPHLRHPDRPGPVLRRVAGRNLAAVEQDGGLSTQCLGLRR
jgi:monofunctional biosynthetic peptidoglycan transglycosylase